jgi:hypothetical protein
MSLARRGFVDQDKEAAPPAEDRTSELDTVQNCPHGVPATTREKTDLPYVPLVLRIERHFNGRTFVPSQ